MHDIFKARAIFNKRNGQIKIDLPKKQLSSETKDMIHKNKYRKLRLRLEGFE